MFVDTVISPHTETTANYYQLDAYSNLENWCWGDLVYRGFFLLTYLLFYNPQLKICLLFPLFPRFLYFQTNSDVLSEYCSYLCRCIS